jgi:hypothetical protein
VGSARARQEYERAVAVDDVDRALAAGRERIRAHGTTPACAARPDRFRAGIGALAHDPYRLLRRHGRLPKPAV